MQSEDEITKTSYRWNGMLFQTLKDVRRENIANKVITEVQFGDIFFILLIIVMLSKYLPVLDKRLEEVEPFLNLFSILLPTQQA